MLFFSVLLMGPHTHTYLHRCRAWCTTCCRRCRAAGGSWTHTSTAWRSTWRSWGRASGAWCRSYPAPCPHRTPPSVTCSERGRWRQRQRAWAEATGREKLREVKENWGLLTVLHRDPPGNNAAKMIFSGHFTLSEVDRGVVHDLEAV